MGDATTSYLPNRKQLIALSQLIFIVWAAAFFFRMRLVESAGARKEFISLAALNSLSQLPIHQVFADRVALDVFAERAHLSIQRPLTDWLKLNQGTRLQDLAAHALSSVNVDLKAPCESPLA